MLFNLKRCGFAIPVLCFSMWCLTACSQEKVEPGQTLRGPLELSSESAGEVQSGNMDPDLFFEAEPDPVEVAPDNFHVLTDVGFIRLLRAEIPAGASIGMHSHPPTAMYVPGDCEIVYSEENGAERHLDLHAGLCFLTDPIPDRLLSNPSERPSELIIFELRDTVRGHFDGPDPLVYDLTRFQRLGGNKKMRVLSLKLPVGDTTEAIALQPYVAWFKNGESVTVLNKEGAGVANHVAADSPAFFGTSPEPVRFVNSGGNPVQLIIAENK